MLTAADAQLSLVDGRDGSAQRHRALLHIDIHSIEGCDSSLSQKNQDSPSQMRGSRIE
jgi:hypothetical protein